MEMPRAEQLAHFPTMPTIPTPTEDFASVIGAIMALKRAVELLTEPDGENTAVHTYVQPAPPTRPRVGDFWLRTTGNMTFNAWVGTDWLVLCTLPHVPFDFTLTQHARVAKR